MKASSNRTCSHAVPPLPTQIPSSKLGYTSCETHIFSTYAGVGSRFNHTTSHASSTKWTCSASPTRHTLEDRRQAIKPFEPLTRWLDHWTTSLANEKNSDKRPALSGKGAS
ncbi:hypothetical protein PMIN04_009622 [Paraphaeosphaeria minitans]